MSGAHITHSAGNSAISQVMRLGRLAAVVVLGSIVQFTEFAASSSAFPSSEFSLCISLMTVIVLAFCHAHSLSYNEPIQVFPYLIMFPVFLSGSKRFWKGEFPYGLSAHYSSVQGGPEPLCSLRFL